MYSTSRSEQSACKPALRDEIRSVTSGLLFLGQTLDTAMELAIDLAVFIRSLYWFRISVTSPPAPLLSQSFPPMTKTAWDNWQCGGKLSNSVWTSLISPPLMQTHLVATSLFGSISRIMLLPSTTVRCALGNYFHCSDEVFWWLSAICLRNSAFSDKSLSCIVVVFTKVSTWLAETIAKVRVNRRP